MTTSYKIRLAFGVVAFVAASVFFVVRLTGIRLSGRETATDRAHRLCESCELESDEVDRLIGIMAESPQDRETLTRIWEQTYDDPEALEKARKLCGPCVDAILDAAGSPEPSMDSTTLQGLGGPGS